jgi:hypothetical protein
MHQGGRAPRELVRPNSRSGDEASGAYREISQLSGLALFVTEFAKAIAIEAARQPPAPALPAPLPAQSEMFTGAA